MLFQSNRGYARWDQWFPLRWRPLLREKIFIQERHTFEVLDLWFNCPEGKRVLLFTSIFFTQSFFHCDWEKLDFFWVPFATRVTWGRARVLVLGFCEVVLGKFVLVLHWHTRCGRHWVGHRRLVQVVVWLVLILIVGRRWGCWYMGCGDDDVWVVPGALQTRVFLLPFWLWWQI